MSNVQWKTEDFHVFLINGLDERMEALTQIVRPKFQTLGEFFSAYFSANTGDEFFPHVAKHARRTVNPPKDSWVAFAPYKRGYKALPHFQIGLWESHLFIVVGIIYEAPQKAEMADRLLQHINIFDQLSENFVISGDHMSPLAIPLSEARDEQLKQLLVRVRDVKKGEFLVGRHIPAEEAIKLSSDEFMQLAEETFDDLLPIYNLMVGK
ncbi:YktB family protein [Lysinibacillus sp. 3P01SB]|uniref:YktB family protein n=1 Tax=Lysinibacillus sp. 3P01SB TaxID=3132284 RepID=UPI0039A41090